jgi:hypothetical protein
MYNTRTWDITHWTTQQSLPDRCFILYNKQPQETELDIGLKGLW